MISVRNKPAPPKKKAPKAVIVVPQDDKLLVMTQRGGKLKAHVLRDAVGVHKKRLLSSNIKRAFLIVEEREDLMFVKEEYKFHMDRLRAMELAYRAAVRREATDFFYVLEASRAFRPHRVKIKWER